MRMSIFEVKINITANISILLSTFTHTLTTGGTLIPNILSQTTANQRTATQTQTHTYTFTKTEK